MNELRRIWSALAGVSLIKLPSSEPVGEVKTQRELDNAAKSTKVHTKQTYVWKYSYNTDPMKLPRKRDFPRFLYVYCMFLLYCFHIYIQYFCFIYVYNSCSELSSCILYVSYYDHFFTTFLSIFIFLSSFSVVWFRLVFYAIFFALCVFYTFVELLPGA